MFISAALLLPVQVDLVDQFVQDDTVPVIQASLPTADQLYGRVDQTYCMCPLPRLGCIGRSGLLSNLPFSPNFVPEAPVRDFVRFVSARILTPKIGIIAEC